MDRTEMLAAIRERKARRIELETAHYDGNALETAERNRARGLGDAALKAELLATQEEFQAIDEVTRRYRVLREAFSERMGSVEAGIGEGQRLLETNAPATYRLAKRSID